MICNQRKLYCRFKFLFLFFLFFLLSLSSINSIDYPEKLSQNTKISIIYINYPDFPRSFFSKSCLRFYDIENNLDELVDFVYFDNFSDNLFPLKFFITNKRAKIISTPAIEYMLKEKDFFNAQVSENNLILSKEEVAYIYNFIYTLHKSLKNYEYDFDILNNNSETHISSILHDSARMCQNENESNENSLFDKTKYIETKNILIKKNLVKVSNSTVEKALSENINVNLIDYKSNVTNVSFFNPLIISLLLFIFFTLLMTAYQTIVLFYDQFYRLSIFHCIQIYDFITFFCAGLIGSIIFLLGIFSNQMILKHNYYFLCLFPLHIIISFTAFVEIKNQFLKKIFCIYWLSTASLSFLYLLISPILCFEFSSVKFFLALPIFIRLIFFSFRDFLFKKITNKKNPAPALSDAGNIA